VFEQPTPFKQTKKRVVENENAKKRGSREAKERGRVAKSSRARKIQKKARRVFVH
jgi:hypothetical protein